MPFLHRTLSIICVVVLGASAGWIEAAAGPAAPPPGPGPRGKPAFAPQPMDAVGAMGDVHAYAVGHKCLIAETASPHFHLIVLGALQAPTTRVLALAEQTLEGLELWSGKPASFAATKPTAQQIYYLVLLADDHDYGPLIDQLRDHGHMGRPQGTDLAKQVAGFQLARAMVARGALVGPNLNNWAVYSASCLAVDAFYQVHGDSTTRPPPWIREGLAAELQRLLCHGRITSMTVAYENNNDPPVTDWGKDVAGLIQRRDVMAASASRLMHMSLDALNRIYYRQMWSFCSFIRQGCGTAPGPTNRFYRILIQTASGVDSEAAVADVLHVTEPRLTAAWHAWAVNAR